MKSAPHYLAALAATLAALAAAPVNANPGHYVLLKGASATRSCLDGLVEITAGEPVPAQELSMACAQVPYRDGDTLVFDTSASACTTLDDFTVTTGYAFSDTYLQYGAGAGTLGAIAGNIFAADENALLTLDGMTGEISRSDPMRCDSGSGGPQPPETITKAAFLKASNTFFSDTFGTSVAISGNTVVAGAPFENSDSTGVNGDQTNAGLDDSGAAYVFVFKDGAWSQQAYLKASNTGYGDNFGYSVAISGDTIVVGAYLEDSNATGVDGDGANNSNGNSGAAYVFVRNGETWSQQAYLKASNTGTQDLFGSSVGIDGDTLVVGAFGEASGATGVGANQGDNTRALAGAAYVFVRNGQTWSQQAYLKAPFTNYQYLFGTSVSVSGDTVVVGSPGEESNATGVDGAGGDNNLANDSGAAFVFHRSGQTWSQQAYLKASNTNAFDEFGTSVAVSGDTVVVGAAREESGSAGVNGNQADNSVGDSGAAYVFTRSNGIWSQQAYLKASNPGISDWFGNSVALHGEQLIVSAVQERSNATGLNGDQANNAANQSGAAYVFERVGAAWSQRAYVKAPHTESYDRFGTSTAVSSGVYVVGAAEEDSDATGVDGADNNLKANAGAAYVILIPDEIEVHLPPGPLEWGSIFNVTAVNFKPNSLVRAFLLSEPLFVGEEMADGQGNVGFQITIPQGFPGGEHSVLLIGLNPDGSERRLSAPIGAVFSGVIFEDGFE